MAGDEVSEEPEDEAPARLPRWLTILLVSLAGLLLEVAYTRVISFKLWYYYTYLVIGLSLLGIGSGGIVVAIWAPVRRAATDRIVARCSLWGALSIAVGYWVIARLPLNTVAIWDYGTWASFRNLGALAIVCFSLFATFIGLGIILATLLGRAGTGLAGLYFADLVGAGAGCLLAIPLIVWLSPPQVVALAALVFGAVGLLSLPSARSLLGAFGAVLVVVLAAGVSSEDRLPSIRVEDTKLRTDGALFSDWGPVFRVDVTEYAANAPSYFLVHDGTWGSGIHRFDGDETGLTKYATDSRAIPFDVLGGPPDRELIIGSAGGQEILASLFRGAEDIEAVELNPVTVSLLTDHFADYTGRLPERPEVQLTQGDGRTYLARSDSTYDLVWYVAPDSYAATNAASSGAFVLSESYLYTEDMVSETLEHLTDAGIMVIQFGELRFEDLPLRTARYIATAREAMATMGIDDPSRHVLVAAELRDGPDLSTIVLKRTPFSAAEVERFRTGLLDIPLHHAIHPAEEAYRGHPVSRLASGNDTEVAALVESFPREIGPIDDDAPFFWHFTSFRDVLADIFEPITEIDPEDSIGERVLLLLLGFAVAYAGVFLLLPFVAVRTTWRALPRKATSAAYFACLGLGFMFYEITMIQRLVRFLGYPTYSLTVTLTSILVSTGLGALLSNRFAGAAARRAVPVLLGVLALLTAFYQLFLDGVTDSLQASSLGVRIVSALLLLVPLGLCLGMFMPLGLGAVSALTDRGAEYVAWGWAVNGFFSVIGSVLTTILAMAFGFRAVQIAALAVYAVAVLAFVRLARPAPAVPDEPVPAAPVLEPSAV